MRAHPRGGPGQQVHLSRAQIEQITCTVRRIPEVVIKVLHKDSNSAKAICGHIDYIGRKGKLNIETDDGTRLSGKDTGRKLLEDWDIDLEGQRRETEFSGARGRRASKVVQKPIFSMPPGTPPKGVIAAVRNFALEKFALQHRYAMVLHTDEPHPHIHLVVKSISEQGVRLNISRDTLRQWRLRFAHYLRQEGVAANATDSFVRGQFGIQMSDGRYRVSLRGELSHDKKLPEGKAHQQFTRGMGSEAAEQHRIEVLRGWKNQWSTIIDVLRAAGFEDLASEAGRFSAGTQSLQPKSRLRTAGHFIDR